MSQEIKSISITGAAAADMTGGKKRRITKKKLEGGSTEAVRGVSEVMNAVKGVASVSSVASTAASPSPSTWLKYPSPAPVPPSINPTPSYVPKTPEQAAGPTQLGGVKHVRVELKKKTQHKKVHLNPKKSDAPKSSKKHHTRKHRKIALGVHSLHKRITRAKKLHKEVKSMPITELKEKLVKSGLIKESSKAPESVLRQMAEDADILKNKAL